MNPASFVRMPRTHDPRAIATKQAHALRLTPGEDLRLALDAFVRAQGLGAAYVATCVGSLSRAAIRFAGKPEAAILEGSFEILSLAGTLSHDGAHLHIAIADADGRTLGGHLAQGSLVRTTAEVVVVALEGVSFGRELDPATGYRELVVRPGDR